MVTATALLTSDWGRNKCTVGHLRALSDSAVVKKDSSQLEIPAENQNQSYTSFSLRKYINLVLDALQTVAYVLGFILIKNMSVSQLGVMLMSSLNLQHDPPYVTL